MATRASDDDFIRVQYPPSEESYVDVDQLSEESSVSSCYAQISIGSCVVLGGYESRSAKQSEAGEQSIIEKSFIVDGDSIISGFESAHDTDTIGQERKEDEKIDSSSSSTATFQERNEDEESDSSSFSTATFDRDLWDIFTNSPHDLSSDLLIKTAADVLFVPKNAARKILDHFNWDMHNICEKYIGDEERVWSLCNVRNQCMAHRSRDIVLDAQQQVNLGASPRVIVCLDCGLENHASLTCSQFGKWSRKCAEEEESVRLILATTVKCPKCSHRVSTDVAYDEALSLPCEKCSFLFGLAKGTYTSRNTPVCKMDELEWFVHCVNLFDFHQNNEDKMKQVRNRFFSMAANGQALGETHYLQAINQLIECHHVLKFSSAALYFKGNQPNDLFEHRRNLLVSLAEDLREVALGEKQVGKLLLLSRTAAVGRFVSSLLDDLDSQCSGNLEPPCNSVAPFNANVSQPVDSRCEDEQVLWCLHPDCLESVDHFSSDSELARHYADAHNGDFGDDPDNNCVSFAASAGTSLREGDKTHIDMNMKPVSQRQGSECEKNEVRKVLSKDFSTVTNPDGKHVIPSFDHSRPDGQDDEHPPFKFQAEIDAEIDASVRLAIKAATLTTDYARRRLADMHLPLSLEACTAFQEGSGELPGHLKEAVMNFAKADRVLILKEKLHGLLNGAAVARTKMSNLTELIGDQEKTDQLFRGFGSRDSQCTFDPLRKKLTYLETWIAQFQSGIQLLFSVLKTSEVEHSFELLHCTSKKLEHGLPRLTGAGNPNAACEGRFIETASLRSALIGLSRLIRERDILTNELLAKASITSMGNLPTEKDAKISLDGDSGKAHRRRSPEDLMLAVREAFGSVDAEPTSLFSLEEPITALGRIPPPEGSFKATLTNCDRTIDAQQTLEVATKTALDETLPSLHDLCSLRARQADLLEVIERENVRFRRALDQADTSLKAGVEFVRAIMGALRTFGRVEREIAERNCSYAVLVRQLDLLEEEFSGTKARMAKARTAAVDADGLRID